MVFTSDEHLILFLQKCKLQNLFPFTCHGSTGDVDVLVIFPKFKLQNQLNLINIAMAVKLSHVVFV